MSSPEQSVEELEAILFRERNSFFPAGRSIVRKLAIDLFDAVAQLKREDLMDRIGVSVRGLGGLPEWILDQQAKALLRTEERYRAEALSVGDVALLRRLWLRSCRNPMLLCSSERVRVRAALRIDDQESA